MARNKNTRSHPHDNDNGLDQKYKDRDLITPIKMVEGKIGDEDDDDDDDDDDVNKHRSNRKNSIEIQTDYDSSIWNKS